LAAKAPKRAKTAAKNETAAKKGAEKKG